MARTLPSKTEMFISGAWTDVTSDVFGRAGEEGAISIQHGMTDLQGTASPDSSTFTLDNRTGAYSNRYPLSTNYGKIPRNTQVRHSVPGAAGDMDLHSLHVEPNGSGQVVTADKATLDITGDIDIRIEATPAYGWRPQYPQILAGKYDVALNSRSWALGVAVGGQLQFFTSQTGTGLGTVYTSAVIPQASTRLAVRVTLDVDLGGTQKVCTFYTSDSITGTYTVLGSASTTAGTTSLFASTAPLEVGSANSGTAPFGGVTAWVGKIHGFEMRSGIAGTLVADYKPNRSGNVVGSAGWADTCATPNTWTVISKARVTSDRLRFVGEMTNLPLTWDKTKRDVELSVQAYGSLRRLSRGGQPLQSPIFRYLNSQLSTNLYFPMEDGANTIRPQPAIGMAGTSSSVSNITLSGSTPTGFPGSAGAVTLNAAQSYVQVSAPGRSTTGTQSAVVYFKNPTNVIGVDQTLFTISGQNFNVEIQVGAAGYTFRINNSLGGLINSYTTAFGTEAPPTGWVAMQIRFTTSSATQALFETIWHGIGSSTFYTHNPGGTTETMGASFPVTRFNVIRYEALNSTAFVGSQGAHFLCTQDTWMINTISLAQASNAFLAETAATRMRRLAAQENVNIDVWGEQTALLASASMGYQKPGTLLDVLADCYKTDGGVFGEARDRLGFVYYCASFFGNHQGLVLSESSFHLADVISVPDDDRYLINDFTATRDGGGIGRTIASDVTYGPNNTIDPPNGVGRVPGGDTFSLATDEQAGRISQFQVFWRTWDEPRIPNLKIGMHRTPITGNAALTRDILGAYLGSPVQLTGMLSIASFESLNMTVLGYTETFDGYLWSITLNTIPQGPYSVGRAEIEGPDGRAPRADTALGASQLNASINSTANTFVVNVTGSPSSWIVGSSAPDFPIFVMMAGELMSVGQIAARAANLQTFSSVTRSLNGVVKAQTVGANVSVRDAVYIGMSE